MDSRVLFRSELLSCLQLWCAYKSLKRFVINRYFACPYYNNWAVLLSFCRTFMTDSAALSLFKDICVNCFMLLKNQVLWDITLYRWLINFGCFERPSASIFRTKQSKKGLLYQAKTLQTFETSVNIYPTIRRHIPEDFNIQKRLPCWKQCQQIANQQLNLNVQCLFFEIICMAFLKDS